MGFKVMRADLLKRLILEKTAMLDTLASSPARTAYEENKNTEIQSCSPSRASVFQVCQSKGNFN